MCAGESPPQAEEDQPHRRENNRGRVWPHTASRHHTITHSLLHSSLLTITAVESLTHQPHRYIIEFIVPCSSLHTLHSSLHTLHSSLHTLHSSLHTLHPSLHTPHSSPHPPGSKPPTVMRESDPWGSENEGDFPDGDGRTCNGLNLREAMERRAKSSSGLREGERREIGRASCRERV